ncbi:hypothetical protein [Streptomyces sp. SID13726]|uniref:hypothetical protein n=1 Tax=Streptomyces sp. SID13726 TaxID=2706058 RepID=UPI001EF22D5F|nr:hypothetical protein [Streptomyces sp. SID13726]
MCTRAARSRRRSAGGIARGIAAPDGVALKALDAAWWRRLCDVDGEFLAAVLRHRIGGNDSWWTRCRQSVQP